MSQCPNCGDVSEATINGQPATDMEIQEALAHPDDYYISCLNCKTELKTLDGVVKL
jgi:hypothetical protein